MRTAVPFTIVDSWVVHDQGPAMFPGLPCAPEGDLVLTLNPIPVHEVLCL